MVRVEGYLHDFVGFDLMDQVLMELVLLFACIWLSFLNQVAIVLPSSEMYFQVHFND